METTISLMIDQYEQGNLTRRQLVSTLAVAMGLGATGRDPDELTVQLASETHGS